jgi:hypothetical protein
MYICRRNLIFKGLFPKETLYKVFSSLNVEEVQNFWTFDFLFEVINGFCQNCIFPLVLRTWPWVRNQGKGLQRCGPKVKLKNQILCSLQCRRVWRNEPTHFQMNSHFGNWNPNGLPNFQKEISRVKIHLLKNSLYHWKAFKKNIFKMGSHHAFEYLKHNLWPKRRVESENANLIPAHEKSKISLI